MILIYKTTSGTVGKCYTFVDLPEGIDKLIIRRYDGRESSRFYANTVVIDCNNYTISPLAFTCDTLSLYRVSRGRLALTSRFALNYRYGDHNAITYINKVIRFKPNIGSDIDYCFNLTGLKECCPLDLSMVGSCKMIFYGSHHKPLYIGDIKIPKGYTYNHVLYNSGYSDAQMITATNLLRLKERK